MLFALIAETGRGIESFRNVHWTRRLRRHSLFESLGHSQIAACAASEVLRLSDRTIKGIPIEPDRTVQGRGTPLLHRWPASSCETFHGQMALCELMSLEYRPSGTVKIISQISGHSTQFRHLSLLFRFLSVFLAGLRWSEALAFAKSKLALARSMLLYAAGHQTWLLLAMLLVRLSTRLQA